MIATDPRLSHLNAKFVFSLVIFLEFNLIFILEESKVYFKMNFTIFECPSIPF